MPQALSVYSKRRLYGLRHLFSGVERWAPLPAEASAGLPGESGSLRLCWSPPPSSSRKSPPRREHSHSVYHVVLFTEGSGFFNFKGEERRFEPGFLALASPDEPHAFGAPDSCEFPVEYRNFTFDMVDGEGRPLRLPFHELLAEFAGASHRAAEVPLRLSPSELRSFLPSLDAAIALGLPGETLAGIEAAPSVMGLLSAISSLLRSSQPQEEAADGRLLKAKSLLERDLEGRLSADALAKAAGLSKAHFLRAFKTAFGASPMRFGRRLRLERAKALLSEGLSSVKSAALETGFCDEFHFANAFRREYGEPPSSFRKRARMGRL